MKNLNLKALPIMGLLFMLAVMSVQAQTEARIEANVPFDFVAGKAKLNAGSYSVTCLSKDMLLLRSADLRTSVVVQAPQSVGQTRADAPQRLVFHQYGNTFFLAQVWLRKEGDGRALYPSPAERTRASRAAKYKARPSDVEVVARAN